MSIRFDGRVAIVTGAGNGLGRAHALGLANLGAKVLVNDIGAAGVAVVEEIREAGGIAMAHGADVSQHDQVQSMVDETMTRWGRIDVLVNNAGILRDRSFAKLQPEDFGKVLDVHLTGTYNCTQAVWEIMRAAKYGRIAFTSSGSGLFGNFGQANYGAAKAAMVGLMNVLHIEGAKYGIRVNTLVPTAATAMTAGLVAEDLAAVIGPETITPGLLYLVSEDAPSRVILGAGGGCFSRILIRETRGAYVPLDERTPDAVAARWDAICDETDELDTAQAFDQTIRFAEWARSEQDRQRGGEG